MNRCKLARISLQTNNGKGTYDKNNLTRQRNEDKAERKVNNKQFEINNSEQMDEQEENIKLLTNDSEPTGHERLMDIGLVDGSILEARVENSGG